MLQKWTYPSSDEEQELIKKRLTYLNRYGHFNQLPTPYKKVDISEYWELRSCYSPEMCEFRQVVLPLTIDKQRRYHQNLHIEWFHDCGYGIVYPSRNRDEILVLRIGCEHDLEEISPDECHRLGIYHGGRCYHVRKCTKCGYVNAVDSSD